MHRLDHLRSAICSSTPAAASRAAPAAAPLGAALFDLSGKVAVVTGGTGVLGGEMCRGLAAAGAKQGC